MDTAIIIIIFLVIFFVALKIGLSFTAETKISKRRIENLADADDSFVELQTEFNQEKSKLAVRIENLLAGTGNKQLEDNEIALTLYRAGLTSPNAPAYYLFFNIFGWIIGGVLLLILYFISQGNPHFKTTMAVGVVLAIICGMGAKLYVKNSTQKRQKILVRSFPDTLDLLLVCVESGLALDAALARVTKELKFAHPMMTKELNRTRIELTMLNDREKALNNFVKRTDLIAVKSLVAALLQSEKFGTSLTETLRVLSDDYRNTRMMLAEEKAGQLSTKITVTTLPLMLAALMTLIISPAIIQASAAFKDKNAKENAQPVTTPKS